ncbi:MAG: P-loop NTPase [Nitrososphaerota archaeon]
MIDPRTTIVDERLKKIPNIIAVSSGKGGVGKSLIATTLALILKKRGHKVGLFDTDLTSPTTHIILNVRGTYPEEKKGVIPPEVYGLKYMSIAYYSGERFLPLRGTDFSNALRELLAITIWDALDFLIIDTPPGIGDATLDIIKLIRKVEFLIVTTPSQLAFETVRKLINLLSELKIPIIGVIENMAMREKPSIQKLVEELGVKFWGEIPFDIKVEEALGDINKLLRTEFSRKLEEMIFNLEPDRYDSQEH